MNWWAILISVAVLGLAGAVYDGAMKLQDRSLKELKFMRDQMIKLLDSLQENNSGEKVSSDNEFDRFRGVGKDSPDLDNQG